MISGVISAASVVLSLFSLEYLLGPFLPGLNSSAIGRIQNNHSLHAYGKTFSITIHGNSKLCIDLAGGCTDNGTPIQIWECNGLPNQQWYLPAGGWKIMYAGDSNKCIDAGNMHGGSKLRLWDCNSMPQQTWGYDSNMRTLYLAGSHSTNLGKSLASKCADLAGKGTEGGTPIQVWTCNGQWQQSWDPVPAGVASDVDALLAVSSPGYFDGIEKYDSTRARMDNEIVAACKQNGCSLKEAAVVWAMAMIEDDKMDHTDCSKGSTSGKSNWSPWNMNMDALGHIGCDSNCARSLGQWDGKQTHVLGQCVGKYNINKAVYWLLKGLRGGTSIGSTCDFLNFHRGGATGWKLCKGQSCSCECGSYKCKGYKQGAADAALRILKNTDLFTNGQRIKENIGHVR